MEAEKRSYCHSCAVGESGIFSQIRWWLPFFKKKKNHNQLGCDVVISLQGHVYMSYVKMVLGRFKMHLKASVLNRYVILSSRKREGTAKQGVQSELFIGG